MSDSGLLDNFGKNAKYINAYIGEIFSKSYFHLIGELYQMEIQNYDFSEYSYSMCKSSTNNPDHLKTQCPERRTGIL